ncbi:DegT/DnrJ/EryC1/StrS family aminotransferase [Streptomyces sp. RG80]|uniref:DegT/DnrJ/EryC1/StrS family aminotransferase n=1 Tax=Streptomyces sp. RG80 TaxID=3157340 RepID=UPI00338F72B6
MTVHRLRPRPHVHATGPPQETGIPFAATWISPEARRAARRVLASGWAEHYDDALKAVSGLQPLDVTTPGRHARHLYVVRVTEEYGTARDELVDRLAEHGIGTSVHFTPLHQMPLFRATALTPPEGLPGAETLFPEFVPLPLYPGLSDAAVDRVCEELACSATHPDEI